MKLPIKVAVVVIIAILLISSVYFVFFTDGGNNNKNNHENNDEEIDDEPPKIDSITGDTTAYKGESVTISVTFSDNVGVTKAILYYRLASASGWDSASILSGSVDIYIPMNSNESWYYYVTVDDEAGNGPVGKPSTDGSEYYIITVLEDGNNGDDEFIHKVFIEEGTARNCFYCPNVAHILFKLFDPMDPDFYYVSLVEDKNSKAEDRLINHYNRHGNPTVFIDGGYEVIFGFNETTFESNLKQKILKAAARDVPKLHIYVNAEWNESRSELTATVNIENKEASTYTGRLRVYVSEILCDRWKDYNNDPYDYAFLDYAINNDVEVKSEENKTFSKVWNAKDAGYSNVYPENLMVYAVVFSSEKNQGYAKPPDGSPFDAYYADATTATRVAIGTLPPTVSISMPKEGFRYFFGRERKQLLIKSTILIGKTTIKATAQAEAGIEKVEFYIDKDLKHNVSKEPYEFTIRKIDKFRHLVRKHTILVKAYDAQGRIATDSIEVITILL